MQCDSINKTPLHSNSSIASFAGAPVGRCLLHQLEQKIYRGPWQNNASQWIMKSNRVPLKKTNRLFAHSYRKANRLFAHCYRVQGVGNPLIYHVEWKGARQTSPSSNGRCIFTAVKNPERVKNPSQWSRIISNLHAPCHRLAIRRKEYINLFWTPATPDV